MFNVQELFILKADKTYEKKKKKKCLVLTIL